MKKIFKGILYILSPFQYSNYFYFWLGAFVSNTGSWVQSLALNWFIVKKLESPFYLGLLNFIMSLPVIFLAPFGGVLADRVNRKTIIWVNNLIMAIAAVVLGVIININSPTIIFWIMVISLVFGIGNSLSAPAWQAYISQLVEKNFLLNAIALNSAQFNLARFIGPVIATLIIARLGMDWCFYINGISFVAVIISMVFIKSELYEHQISKTEISWVKEMTDGWMFIKNNKDMSKKIISAGVVSFFGMCYIVLLPIYAKTIFKGEVHTLGILMSSSGLGAFSGAMIVSLLNLYFTKKRLIKYGLICFSIAISVFAVSKNVYFASLCIFIAAFSFITTMSSVNTTIQDMTPETYRGRIMSSFVWMFMGLMPFGALFAGVLASLISPQITLLICCIITFLWSVFVMK